MCGRETATHNEGKLVEAAHKYNRIVQRCAVAQHRALREGGLLRKGVIGEVYGARTGIPVAAID